MFAILGEKRWNIQWLKPKYKYIHGSCVLSPPICDRTRLLSSSNAFILSASNPPANWRWQKEGFSKSSWWILQSVSIIKQVNKMQVWCVYTWWTLKAKRTPCRIKNSLFGSFSGPSSASSSDATRFMYFLANCTEESLICRREKHNRSFLCKFFVLSFELIAKWNRILC